MLPYYIYKLITKFIRPFIALYILIRISKGKEDRTRIAERYGTSDVERKKGKVIWFHAASIGESLSILPLLRKLNSDKSIDQIILTTGTLTSANILKSKLSKKIISSVKQSKLKVQVKIQGNELRVSGQKKDSLQEVISLAKKLDLPLPLQFINFRD